MCAFLQGFHNLNSLVGQMLDVHQLIGLCVHLDRAETFRSAEYKVTQVICLKQSLDLVETLKDSLGGFDSEMLRVIRDVSSAKIY